MNKFIEYVDKTGKHVDEETPTVYAKRTDKRFYAKVATVGLQIGCLVDPWSPYGDSYSDKKINSRTGKSAYEFKEVDEETYKLYVRYLETQNMICYLQAGRIMI